MKIIEKKVLRGPNIWAPYRVIELICDCNNMPLNINPHFLEQIQHHYALTLELSTPQAIATSFMSLIVAMHEWIGCFQELREVMPIPHSDFYRIIIAYKEEKTILGVITLAEKVFQSHEREDLFTMHSELSTLKDIYEDIILGPSTQLIINAAIERQIPYRRLTEGSLIQLGWGNKQQRIAAAETSTTSAIAENIAQDKNLTKEFLYMAGLPVAYGYVAQSPLEAQEIATRIGFPVVIKPLDGNQGRAVFLSIHTLEDVAHAYTVAHQEQEISDEVLIEKQITGLDYRCLVVNNRLVAAAHRDPPYVIADGCHSIQELIDQCNQNPERKKDHIGYLTTITVDDVLLNCLKNQNYTLSSIPESQQKIILRYNANLSNGGSATDVTSLVHPEIADLMIQATQIIGLNIAGVDLICTDISQPLAQQENIAIIEINASPGLRMHVNAAKQDHHKIGEAIIESLFPEDNGRIPIIAVTGSTGKTTVTSLIAHGLTKAGYTVGMTRSTGTYINNQPLDKGDCSGPRSAQRILMHPHVDAAVFETARGGILREGLGFDHCDVAVVTNIGHADHLGMDHIHTPQDMQKVKQLIVTRVPAHGSAVLNAEDPLVMDMSQLCLGTCTYFALNKESLESVPQKMGNKYLYVDNTHIVFEDGSQRYLVAISDIPFTHNGLFTFQLQNVMAAIGALRALHCSWEAITIALKTFFTTIEQLPGRLNFFQYNQATIIADWGHTIDAMKGLCALTQNIPAPRYVLMTSAAGDRTDESILHQMYVLGSTFDTAVLYQDTYQRGRKDGEIFTLMRDGLSRGGKVQDYTEIHDEVDAIGYTLEQLQPNDLCLMLIDNLDVALPYLQKHTTPITTLET